MDWVHLPRRSASEQAEARAWTASVSGGGRLAEEFLPLQGHGEIERGGGSRVGGERPTPAFVSEGQVHVGDEGSGAAEGHFPECHFLPSGGTCT